MRAYRGSYATETNTFSLIPTGVGSFHREKTPPERDSSWARALAPFVERGDTIVGNFEAGAAPSGAIVRASYEQLRDEMLAEIERSLPLDFVVLSLHGAMVADGYDDCEGDVLARVRKIVGPDALIGATLDPHCHLTQEMIDASNLILIYKEYPHTDSVDRLVELVVKLIEIKEGRLDPVPTLVEVPVISFYHTDHEPMRSFVDRLFAQEGKDGIASISIAHGFPWGDVPEMRTKVLVYTNGSNPHGKVLARKLAEELFALRGTTYDPLVPYREAVETAMNASGITVIGDYADNPGGGAASDSTFILRELLDRGAQKVAIGPIWDPVAVSLAMLAGEGARIKLRIGGKVGPTSGDPVDVEGIVSAIRPDYSAEIWAGNTQGYGDTVVMHLENDVDIVLVTNRAQVYSRTLFTGAGIDIMSKRIIVCKSSHHFSADFTPLADRVIHAGTPGMLRLDFANIPYRKIRRPLWPIDDIKELPA